MDETNEYPVMNGALYVLKLKNNRVSMGIANPIARKQILRREKVLRSTTKSATKSGISQYTSERRTTRARERKKPERKKVKE